LPVGKHLYHLFFRTTKERIPMPKSVVRLAVAFAALWLATAHAETAADNALVGRFSATTSRVNTGTGEAGKNETLRVDLLRWSTDAERDQLAVSVHEKRAGFR
jgi:hypothetical protein